MTTSTTPQAAGIVPVSDPEQAQTAPVSAPDAPVSGGFTDDDLAPAGHVGPWTPTTVRDVEWCLERAGEAEADLAEVQAQLDAAVKALHARAMAITEKANRRALWFRGLVEAWAVANRGEVVRGKAKSRELLGGTIAFRASAEKVVVTDEAAFLAWAQPDHLDLLRFPEPEIDKKKLDALVKGTGEVPPGVDVKPATETVTVKVNPLPMLGAAKKEIA